MQIQTLKPPVAGENLIVKVAGCNGKTNIKVSVGDKRVLEHEHVGLLCNLSVEVPPGTGGETLLIKAVDATGNPRQLKFEISDSDPGPHSMLAGVRRDWNTPVHTKKSN